ncbi:TetR/AcrR family transcriptional regulator [Planctomonas sp. JC2975]|uniref:TetR/AcrR family transcriptional regulator n=1 Tax=Planctomonas sp. JC2975 TaxID=2729626 RepID=UPI00147276C4|nr:TetR/AcrR family transcriptional regulator [Planctomonas sp. JC2975]NNC12566.1 TetR/AcrR family transcriptional regulator [Planctomonas sp. JC2975]
MTTSDVRSASDKQRSYHHGNLRDELLVTAEAVLREKGVEQVTLRDLARRAGVSHAAPSRHFPDREALLLALAATGYERLGRAVMEAREEAGDNFDGQFRAVATVFVRFAVESAALVEVMFTIGKGTGSTALQEARSVLYDAFGSLVEEGVGRRSLRRLEPDRLKPLIIATLQGVAAFAAAGTLPSEAVDSLIDDACSLFII